MRPRIIPLVSGEQVGPYQIIAPLGAGGMGEVYRARDPRLGRDVALKILPHELAGDPSRRARFEREARAVAALNHPNIVAVYDVGEGYIVSELVDGEPLRAGTLGLRTTIEIAVEIASGLAAAHDAGIVHRDLKPANILLTRDGRPKILDFGLAKVQTADAPPEDETVPVRTEVGLIMGTPGYMSPEQVRGLPADHRSDIFSLGVILHELLSGRRTFEGQTSMDTMTAILKEDAPELPETVPAGLRQIVTRCLEKSPAKRFQSAHDLGFALSQAGTQSGSQRVVTAAAPALQGRRVLVAQGSLPWIAAGVLALSLGGALWTLSQNRAAPSRGMVQMDIDAFPDEVLDPVISPDGSRVVFVWNGPKGRRLAMRRMDQPGITVLADTDGARFPFFSPDGGSVGFFTSDGSTMAEGGRLKRLSLSGGVAVVLADAAYPGGGTWGTDDTIAASLNQWATGIVSRIPAAGGTAQALTVREPERQPEGPEFLPNGKGLLFTRKKSQAGFTFDLCVAVLGQTTPKVLVHNGSGPHYLDSGHLVFYRAGKIFAARFDLDRLEVIGEPAPMVEAVADQEGIAQFSLSRGGDLVYRRGQAPQRTVVAIDSSGGQTVWIAAPGDYITPRVSPGGKQLAVVDQSSGGGRILIRDIVQGTTRRLTLDEHPQGLPAWTPDGTRIVFVSGDKMLSARADGAGQPEVLTSVPSPARLSFSRDGKLAAGDAVGASGEAGDQDLWVAPVDFSSGSPRFGKPVVVAGGKGHQEYPVFSPDGRFVAYMSNETGVYQVYVVSLSADGRPAGGKWQVSTTVGYNPAWPALGGILSFEGDTGHLDVVPYSIKGDTFLVGPPRVWAPVKLSYYSNAMSEATPDGKQMIAIVDAESNRPETHVRVILNFGEEVRRRLGGGAK